MLRRIFLAMLGGWLASWAGVAGLIVLGISSPHDPVPWILLAGWAVATAVALVIPGGPFSDRQLLMLVIAGPFIPVARAAIASWPHLPAELRELLEGGVSWDR